MMDSFLSFFPKGLFGLKGSMDIPTGTSQLASSWMVAEENGQKRTRTRGRSRSRTPTLIPTGSGLLVPAEDYEVRPAKRFRGEVSVVPVYTPNTPLETEAAKKAESPSPLSVLPEDVVANCLSFLGEVEDRFALQCTSKQFRRISNSDEMLIGIQVGGDRDTGLNGIIHEHDTPETAAISLTPFAVAGNLEAIYMLGIIKSYCNRDVEGGISLLKMASSQGYTRSSYALGLVLRDSQADEAAKYMKAAADAGYLPALQEMLSARTMKAKYGEPNAEELRRHLDPLCLNRLLSRHYTRSADLRDLNTSHCWNPLCGRWAFKATVNNSRSNAPPRRRFVWLRRRSPTASRRISASEDDELDVSQNTASIETMDHMPTPEATNAPNSLDFRVSRMKMCSRCCRAKYCSKLCQVYDWRSGRHKMECQFL